MKNINDFLEKFYPNYSISDEILQLHDLEKEAFDQEYGAASKHVLSKLAYYEAAEQSINEAIKHLNESFTVQRVYSYEDLIKPENRAIKDLVISKFEVFTDHLYDDFHNSLDAFKETFKIDIERHKIYLAGIDEDISNLSGKRLMSYIYNNVLPKISHRKPYYLKTVGADNNKIKYSNLTRYYDAPFTGVMYDDYLIDPILELWTNKERYNDTLYDLLSEGVDNAYEAFEEELEYRHTEEAILEDIAANNYKFNDKGELI